MSINITKNTAKTATVSANTQPRDAQGRFASMPVRCDIPKAHDVTNLDSAPKEVKQLKSLNMNEIEWTAPYIYNFIKDNGIVKEDVAEGQISACVYLNKGTESWYCFLTHNNAYGFHLSCGALAEVLNREEVMNLLPKYNILYWDAIQRV